ncbi:unnamed protein product [Paramecium primaurelia]|uniref:Transmembrane protein n=1 Tax=Paramecium primaurelia TaxID=5886 RepID=A0A8S1PB42_PARPR|nr:unnamed protein product [Paramecium primaurelia]
MSIEKDCLIIFDEKEEIPFQIEIEDQKNKQYLTYPLSLDKFDLIRFISKTQKYQLIKKIEYMKKYIEIVEQPLQFTQKINQNLENYLPDVMFGPKSLQPNAGQYGFLKEYQTQVLQQSQAQISFEQNTTNIPGSNVAILIYKGETYESLTHEIQKYSNEQTKIKPIILINGKSAFKKLMRSNEELFLSFYQTKYVPFQQKFMTSNHHTIYFQIKNEIGYFFVFCRQLEQLDLIKWIYQGILKLIQPKFVVIASSNEVFLENINILQLFTILENNQYFGISCLKKIKYNGRFWNSQQGDFADIALKLDSMFKIKQFHNPLSCIYEWSRIEPIINDYIRKLESEYFTNSWALGYNSILPRIMIEYSGKELKIITNYIIEQQFSENQFEIVFNQFCEYQQNINNQLRKCRFHLFKNILQWFISKIQVIYNYFGISICFFFSFQCPYQLIYNLFEESIGYTALAVILPIFYTINVLLFLLLTQLYHFNDKIIEKGYDQEIAMMAQKNDKQEFLFQTSVSSQNIDVLFTKEYDKQNEINFEVQEDEYIKNTSYSMGNELLQENELYFLYKFPQLKYISVYINYLIDTQNYLDFGVTAFIIANLIIIHGKILITEQSTYEIILLIFVIFVLIFQLTTKKLGIVWIFVKLSMITYFWQFLQVPKQVTSAQQRSIEKRKLGTQLMLNFILFYTFIAIESYYNYSGYILIGVFGYLALVYIIIGIFTFIQYIFYNSSIPQEKKIWEGEKFVENYTLNHKLHQDANHILVENTRKLVADTTQGKKAQQLMLQTQLMNDQGYINLTNTIRIQIKEELEKHYNVTQFDLNQIKKLAETAIIQQIQAQYKDQKNQNLIKKAEDTTQTQQGKQQNQNEKQQQQNQALNQDLLNSCKQSDIKKIDSNIQKQSEIKQEDMLESNRNKFNQFGQSKK